MGSNEEKYEVLGAGDENGQWQIVEDGDGGIIGARK